MKAGLKTVEEEYNVPLTGTTKVIIKGGIPIEINKNEIICESQLSNIFYSVKIT